MDIPLYSLFTNLISSSDFNLEKLALSFENDINS